MKKALTAIAFALALALAPPASAEMTGGEKDNALVAATFVTGAGAIVAGISAATPAAPIALGIAIILSGFAAAKENKDARDATNRTGENR